MDINKSVSFIVLVFVFNLSAIHSQSACRTPTNAPGTCIVLQKCTTYYNLILNSGGQLSAQERTLLQNSWCGSENNQHKVCCPTPTQAPTSGTQTVSARPADYTRHQNANLLDSNLCGNIVDNKIVNGNKTEPFQYPWMAIIQYLEPISGAIEQKCGGSIINKRYVLTAAHCISFLQGGMQVDSVVLGEHDTKSDNDCDSDGYCTDPIQIIPVERLISHPDYNRRQFVNDIGLLRLASDIDFYPESVRPICLPTTIQQQTHQFGTIKITGWGKTETGSVSSILLQANLPVVNRSDCVRQYNQLSRVKIVETHLCAGGRTSDSCSGDSGGPGISPSNTQLGLRFVQYGVVSFGASICDGLSPLPGIYTRVSSYMDWIMNNISP